MTISNLTKMEKKFFERVENTVAKEKLLVTISPFPAVFLKGLYCRHVKKQGLFGKGLMRGTFENIVEKEKILVTSIKIFLLFSQCFSASHIQTNSNF